MTLPIGDAYEKMQRELRSASTLGAADDLFKPHSSRGSVFSSAADAYEKMQQELKSASKLGAADDLFKPHSSRSSVFNSAADVYEKLQRELRSAGTLGAADDFFKPHSSRSSVFNSAADVYEKLQRELKSARKLGAVDDFLKSHSSLLGIRPCVKNAIFNDLGLDSDFHLRTAALIAKSCNLAELQSNAWNDTFVDQSTDAVDKVILQQKLEDIAGTQDTESLAELVKTLPPWLHQAFKFIYFIIILPLVASTFSSIVDIYVKHLAECRLLNIPCETDDISNIQSIQEETKSRRTLSFEEIDLTYSRFVSKKYLNVYVKPNQKSEILDELTRGQVVVLIQKERNWAEIAFRNEKKEVYQGWVFNRYLKKFD